MLFRSIPSLTKICDAFGITLSQFFLEDGDNVILINEQQRQLLHHAAKLSPQQYEALLHFLKLI